MKFVPNYPAITFLKRCLAPTEKLAKMQQISLQKTYTKPKIILSDWYYCVFLIDLRPPKAKVTRSHRVWCATKFNDLEVAWRLEKARLLLAIVRAGLEAMRQSLCFTRLGAYGPVMRLPAGALSPCRKPAARMHAYRSCHCRFSPTASNQILFREPRPDVASANNITTWSSNASSMRALDGLVARRSRSRGRKRTAPSSSPSVAPSVAESARPNRGRRGAGGL